ncbi:MAG TPA: TadE/TadG family type IV pilus assembly protein [Gemmatimonadota bacterium]|nr:TadE/TadG family type IV pilus assembly protein [Gemmatimonadota bacterium]
MSRAILSLHNRRETLGERGQSLVEFAIALPVLLAIVIGIFEFGMAWNQRQVITNAAREGARVGVLQNMDDDDVENAVANYLTNANLDPDLATVSYENVGGTGDYGMPTTVNLSYPYEFRFIGPIVALLQGDDSAMAGTISLQTTAVMRHE